MSSAAVATSEGKANGFNLRHSMRTLRSSVAVLLAVALACAAAAHAADKGAAPPADPPTAAPAKAPKTPPVKAKKPAADPADALINDAITKLSAEYDAARKGKALRTEADYFESPPPALTAEKVLNAIAKPVAKEPAMDAYVRWQLLSAIANVIDDEKLAAKVLTIYRSAPQPMPRIGTEHNSRKVLNRMVQDRSVSDAQAITQFENAMEKWVAYNAPIYAFRDALLAKARPSADLIVAAIGDAADRYRAADPKAGSDQLEAVHQVTSAWAISAGRPRQKMQVADAVERLRKAQPVEYAVEIETGLGNRFLRFSEAQPSKALLDQILEALRVSPMGGEANDSDKKGR